MSRLVTSSPHSQSAITTPLACSSRFTAPKSTNSSSYLKQPSPFSSTTSRCWSSDTSAGRSASSRSTSSVARVPASVRGPSLRPGSPWSPMPMAMRPLGTSNNGWSAPGRVQPLKATPNVRVRPLALRASRSTSSRGRPASAAAPATLYTARPPAMPRRNSCWSMGALAMSSVTVTMRTSIPWRRSRSAPSVKCSTSPA